MSQPKKPWRGLGLGIMRRLRGARPDETELVIRECMRLIQGGVFYDIGANVGHISEAMLPHAKRIVAVEPDPRTFAELAARLGGKVQCIEALVGPEGAERTFLFNTKASTSSASVAPEHDPEGHGYLERSSMRAVSLDRLAREHGQPDLIKIDVEGSELSVLDSGLEVLSHHPVVVMEFNALCLAQFGRINPRDAIERILNMFPKVEVITAEGRSVVNDPYYFLSQNIIAHRSVDNLVCSWG
jgi:FkbM family methyltransferase